MSEFKRKLSWAGVRAWTNEEQLIYVINEAIEKANLDLAEAFSLIDKDNKGLITKQEFRDTFNQETIAIDKADLERFVDFFWQGKEEGINYKDFLSIFNRYKIRMKEEERMFKKGH